MVLIKDLWDDVSSDEWICISQEEADSAKEKELAGLTQTVKQPQATVKTVFEFDEKEEAEYLKLEHAFKIKLGLISEEEG